MSPPRSSFSCAALGVLALAALPGCGSYISDYVPPPDGRARPVFRDGKVEMEVGPSLPTACLASLAEIAAGAPPPHRTQASPVRVSGGFWVPIYFGPRIVVTRRGVAPPPPHVHRPSPGVRPGPGGVTRVPASPSPGSKPGGGGGGATSGGGGGGGSEAAKAFLASVAVLALAALPAVAVGLSLGRPEDDEGTAIALDRVNTYNDVARTPGSPCAAAMPGGQAP